MNEQTLMSITLIDFLSAQIKSLPKCQESTKSYIINVFSQPNMGENDFSKSSITLLYSNAKFAPNFSKFQRLGDWLLFVKSLFPASLSCASSEYYEAIAQDCYYKCYKLINKTWPIFEELADTFPQIVTNLQHLLLLNSTERFGFNRLWKS